MLLVFLSSQNTFNDIIGLLRDMGGGIGLTLIILGALQAFLWKLAFYINLALGLIVTIVLTYMVSLFNVGFGWLALIFLAGLGLSLMAAFLGAFLAIVEGYMWSALGLFVYCLSNGLNFTTSILAGAIGAAVVVGIVAFVGGSLGGWLARSMPSVRRPRRFPRGWRHEGSSQESSSQYPNSRGTTPPPAPTVQRTVRPEFYTASGQDFCKVCNMDFVYYGVSDALKCPNCGNVFHHDCLNEYVKLNGTCPGCNIRMESI